MQNENLTRSGSLKSQKSNKDRRKGLCGRLLRAVWGTFSDYADSSSIHGVQYLAEPKRPLAERVWWIISICLSCYGCFHFIMIIYNKWEQTPVIISFADKSSPVWQIPFPAITICPEIKSMPDFLNYSNSINALRNSETENITEESLAKLEAIFHVCQYKFSNLFDQDYTNGKKCVDYLREAAPRLEETLNFCAVPPDRTKRCNDIFTPVITDIGICYTFNLLNQKEMFHENNIQKDYNFYNHSKESTNWTLDDGYDNDAPFDTYPMRVLTSNARDSISIYLQSYENDYDYICGGSIPGYKIAFHTPSDYPQFNKHYHRVLLDEQVTFLVMPQVTTTSSGLRYYKPNKRQCYFNDERQLRFFKVYTKRNCDLECLANYTLYKCGCVKYSMPNVQGTPICGTKKIDCYEKAEYELATNQQKEILSSGQLDKITRCNCLPSCSYIEYTAEDKSYDLNRENVLKALNINTSEIPVGLKRSVVTVVFKYMEFIPTKRSELYGPTDFVANCGGLLGLFMGVSILSIVEIFYFCTIRLFSNMIMRKRLIKQKSIKDTS